MSTTKSITLVDMVKDEWPMVILTITPEGDCQTFMANIDEENAYHLLLMASQRAVTKMVERAKND